MIPLSASARRLCIVQNAKLEEDKKVWPGGLILIHAIETLIFTYAYSDLISAFNKLEIRVPGDLKPHIEELQITLRGKYNIGVKELFATSDIDWFYYDLILNKWGVEVNLLESVFLLFDARKLVSHDEYEAIVRAADNAGTVSMAYVMSAARRTHDRESTRRRRQQEKLDAFKTLQQQDSKQPIPPDEAAAFLTDFETARDDAKIIDKDEDRLTGDER